MLPAVRPDDTVPPFRANRWDIVMIDFYVLTSPNVQKIFIMLEELELPYRAIPVDVWKGDHSRRSSAPSIPTARFR